MNKTRYFKIKYGYGAADQVSISEQELDKAIYAQVTGKPVQVGTSYINGRNIISITPHYHRHTGWYDWYEPNDGDDWKQIERDCPSYDGIIEAHKERVHGLIKSGQLEEIGKGSIAELPELRKRISEQAHGVRSVQQLLGDRELAG